MCDCIYVYMSVHFCMHPACKGQKRGHWIFVCHKVNLGPLKEWQIPLTSVPSLQHPTSFEICAEMEAKTSPLLVYVYECFACTYSNHVHSWCPTGQRGHQLWNWSYRCLLTTIWVLGNKPRTSLRTSLLGMMSHAAEVGRSLSFWSQPRLQSQLQTAKQTKNRVLLLNAEVLSLPSKWQARVTLPSKVWQCVM